MSDIPCAFNGHVCRRSVCKGKATSFFRTAKGTLWPLCDACNDRHKIVGAGMVKRGHPVTAKVIKASFDIPIDNEAVRTEFEAQDPEVITSVVRAADEMSRMLGSDDL